MNYSRYLDTNQNLLSQTSTVTGSVDFDDKLTTLDTPEWAIKIIESLSAIDVTSRFTNLIIGNTFFMNTLYSSGCINLYKYYLAKDEYESPILLGIFNLGNNIESYPQTTHGGFSATIADNCLGALAIQIFKQPVTKILNISYKKPIKVNQTILVDCRINRGEFDHNQKDRVTVTAKIFNSNEDLLLIADAVFVDVSTKTKWNHSRNTKSIDN
ncbi:thioesterase family protein [Cryptosporidium andersoni]|uniref:Thioesterase family protein n=1 Tax=Cryptosporidium andersoni TaxID=117008 RepID=A0A1J4MUK3_9CRYT|nr:thioesterase family protein [Cryptosporidium andersoni]